MKKEENFEIDTSIQLFDVEQKIMEQAKSLLEIKLVDPNDSKAYKEADGNRAKFRKLRLEIEKKAKELKKPAQDYVKHVNNKAGFYVDALKPVEEHLKKELAGIDRQREKIKEAEQARRIKLLVDAGFLFDGSFYVAGQVMISPNKIVDFDEDELNQHIESGKRELERIEQKRKEQEEQEEKRQKKLAKEKKEIEDEKRKLAKERKELADQKEKLAKATKKSSEKPNVQKSPSIKRVNSPSNDSQKNTKSEFISDYDKGFNDCKERIIETVKSGVLPGEQKFTRRGLINFISNLEKAPF